MLSIFSLAASVLTSGAILMASGRVPNTDITLIFFICFLRLFFLLRYGNRILLLFFL